jgi:hypothetical protein
MSPGIALFFITFKQYKLPLPWLKQLYRWEEAYLATLPTGVI